MDIKGVLLLVEPEGCAGRIGIAVRIASRYGAELTALCRHSEPIPDLADCYAAAEVLAHRSRDLARMVAPAEAAFRLATSSAEVRESWTLADPGASAQEIANHARSFDLAVVGRPGPHDHDGRRLAELAIFLSGTPCLVVPEGPQVLRTFDRIVVAWNNSRQAKRAIQDSLALLMSAKSVRLTRIAEAPGDEAADEAMLAYLARHGVAAELERIKGADEQAGLILLHQISVFDGDLLIMGAFRRSPVAEAILGGTTRTILARASVPVLMSH